MYRSSIRESKMSPNMKHQFVIRGRPIKQPTLPAQDTYSYDGGFSLSIPNKAV